MKALERRGVGSVEFREWGDGGGDARPHVIERTSYATVCRTDCRCGATISGETPEALERAWDSHRGLVQVPARRSISAAELADNSAVSDFLSELMGEPTPAGGVFVSVQYGDPFDAVADLLERRSSCTCGSGGDIRDCPNYQLGDEEDDND
jgi:hypothetical protein